MDGALKGLDLYETDKKLSARILFLEQEWARAYPGVDIRRELAWSHAWLKSNPTRMKKDFPRFLNNWMKSAQERSSSPAKKAALPPPPKYEIPDEDVCTAEMFAELRRTLRNGRP